MHKLFTRLSGGWFFRWALEMTGWGYGIIQTYFLLYNSLPPRLQEAIDAAWAGRWEEISLAAVFALIPVIWARAWSFMATTQTQAVTTDGTKIVPRSDDGKAAIDMTAARVTPKPTLIERIFGRR